MLVIWHHSLAVRTHASHAWDRSSILRGATRTQIRLVRVFFLCSGSTQEPNLSSRMSRLNELCENGKLEIREIMNAS